MPPPLKLTELLYAYDLAIAARTCDTVAAVCLSVVIYGDERVKHALTRKDVINNPKCSFLLRSLVTC